MNTPPFDRDALTALLAVQMNMIGREDLAAALEAHLADPRRPFLETLQENGTLTAADRAALDPVVDRLLGRAPDAPALFEPMLSQGAEGPVLSGFEGSVASVAQARREPAASPRETSLDEAEDSRRLVAGRFRILGDEPHAQGGLGRVWRARDEQLGRIVALKEIRDDKAHDPSHRARFLLEAEINGGLEHPGIVPVHDRGESRDGRPFYAMRFIEGDDLHQVIESRRRENPRLDPNSIEIRMLLTRFLDICRAIDYAHGRGVVHRDIKPRNIMLGPYGEAVIIDWGLAKAAGRVDGDLESIPVVEPPSAHELDATRVGSRMGTPEYMSPEQAAGETDRIGPLSDVYGLGATLHHLLTGRPPVVGSDRKEIFEKVRRGEIDPLRKLDPRIHPALEAICSKALATRPEDRYASVAKLADDLERHLADESISARRDSLLERIGRWTRKHAAITATAAAVVLLSTLSLGIFLSRERSHSTELLAEKTETDRRLDQVMASYEDYFSGFNEDAIKGGKLPASLMQQLLAKPRDFYVRLTNDLAARGSSLPKERALLARGRMSLARIHNLLGRFDDSIAESTAAVALWDELLAEQSENVEYLQKTVVAQSNLASNLIANNLFEEATKISARAVAASERLRNVAPQDSKSASLSSLSLQAHGRALSEAGRPGDAVPHLHRALEFAEELLARQPDDEEIVVRHAAASVNLGNAFAGLNRHLDAMDVQRGSIDALRRFITAHPEHAEMRAKLATTLQNHGQDLSNDGENESAVRVLTECVAQYDLAIRAQPNVPDHLLGKAMGLDALGRAYGHADEHERAVEHLQRAIEIHRKLVASDPSALYRASLATSLLNLSGAQEDIGASNDAEASAVESIAIYRELIRFQPNVPDYRDGLGISLNQYGKIRRHVGDSDGALSAHREALATFEQMLANYPDMSSAPLGLATSARSLALIHQTQRNQREAIAVLDQGIKRIEQEKLDSASIPLLQTLANLHDSRGYSLVSLRRNDEAIEAYRRAILISDSLIDRSPTAEIMQSCSIHHVNFGVALENAEQRDEAKREYLKAFELGKKVIERDSRVPDHHGSLSFTLSRLADLHVKASELDEALQAADVSLRAAGEAARLAPLDPAHRERLWNRHLQMFELLLETNRLEEAIAVAQAAGEIHPKSSTYQVLAARALAMVAGTEFEIPNREAIRARALTGMLESLRRAVAVGWRDVEVLERIPQFAGFREHPEFRAILERIRDLRFPADPFAPPLTAARRAEDSSQVRKP